MTPEVQEEYNRMLRAVVLAKGALTDPGNHAYGWIADDWQHKHNCVLTSEQTPDESEWAEFGGSFTDHHPTKYGIDLKGVNCACGQIQDRTARWDCSPSEAIQAVFEKMTNNARSAT
jgi:hypothetical protein